jgi:hypothetical protein
MKPSPLVRAPFRREGPTAPRQEHPKAKANAKLCAHCGKPFIPFQSMQKVCPTVRCAKGYALAQRKAKEKAEREEVKARKQAVKRLRDLIAEAQVEFNAYIRARDAGTTCICCGKPFEPQKPGGSMDAGHYLARSIAPQHRFNENNVFGQRKNCNRPGGATRGAFRAGVIGRIGLAAVEALEADVAVKKWTREELLWIKAHYRAKRRELEKQEGQRLET